MTTEMKKISPLWFFMCRQPVMLATYCGRMLVVHGDGCDVRREGFLVFFDEEEDDDEGLKGCRGLAGPKMQ